MKEHEVCPQLSSDLIVVLVLGQKVTFFTMDTVNERCHLSSSRYLTDEARWRAYDEDANLL